jgi:hypothetical protein
MALPRNPPVKGFNYSISPTRELDVAQGFGLTLKEFANLKVQFWEVFKKVNPDMIKYQAGSARKKKEEHMKQFYEAFPSLCEVPDEWKGWAIGIIFTNTRSRESRPTTAKRPRPRSPSRSRSRSRDPARARSQPSSRRLCPTPIRIH